MSLRKCATIRCPHYVREGLRRFGTGVDGQELADGRFCWRCRAKHARPFKPRIRTTVDVKAALGRQAAERQAAERTLKRSPRR